jgi:hypothetical protein
MAIAAADESDDSAASVHARSRRTFSSGMARGSRLPVASGARVCIFLLFGVGVLTLVYRVVVGVGAVPAVIRLALTGFWLYGA